ncbi:hypothetical protein RB195_003482 [Necator americanus]|uniref:Reverse transcriptase domain-containing protein n=1 Tax=Necator americanus TaxID=51031 RepID=A0ABR1DNS2_NECAM
MNRDEALRVYYDDYDHSCCRAARAPCNHELTSELASRCRDAIEEDLKERRAEVLAEAADAEVSRVYKMPLFVAFIDLQKAFDSAETEVVSTSYIKILPEPGQSDLHEEQKETSGLGSIYKRRGYTEED